MGGCRVWGWAKKEEGGKELERKGEIIEARRGREWERMGWEMGCRWRGWDLN